MNDRCYICCNILINEPYYLPMNDDYIGQNVSIIKNTYIIKAVEPFEFLYYYLCNNCINKYIEYYGTFFKYIKNREIGINIKLKKNIHY